MERQLDAGNSMQGTRWKGLDGKDSTERGTRCRGLREPAVDAAQRCQNTARLCSRTSLPSDLSRWFVWFYRSRMDRERWTHQSQSAGTRRSNSVALAVPAQRWEPANVLSAYRKCSSSTRCQSLKVARSVHVARLPACYKREARKKRTGSLNAGRWECHSGRRSDFISALCVPATGMLL